jgi:chromosome segregation ATPase
MNRGPRAGLIVILLVGCTQSGTVGNKQSIQNRVESLERRVESLERRDTVIPAPPLRTREEIEANIQTLEKERDELMIKYTEAHPVVRDLDRRLRILREQLEMLQ